MFMQDFIYLLKTSPILNISIHWVTDYIRKRFRLQAK